MLADAATNHLSWFGRGRERVELDGVSLFFGDGDAVIAFPRRDGDVAGAVRRATDGGAREVGCWALKPDDELGEILLRLGFQDGWQPHWMGIDPRAPSDEPDRRIESSVDCAPDLPYSSPHHRRVLGGDVHHFTVRTESQIVGHTVLNVAADCAGIYDMGVAEHARRQGYGLALTLAALCCARDLGCTSVTLNATGEGEPVYRRAGFRSLGFGMTWWLFPGRR